MPDKPTLARVLIREAVATTEHKYNKPTSVSNDCRTFVYVFHNNLVDMKTSCTDSDFRTAILKKAICFFLLFQTIFSSIRRHINRIPFFRIMSIIPIFPNYSRVNTRLFNTRGNQKHKKMLYALVLLLFHVPTGSAELIKQF